MSWIESTQNHCIESIKCVRKVPDLRWKLSKVTKMGEAVARLSLKIEAKFLYQINQIRTPFVGKGLKKDKLLMKIMNNCKNKGCPYYMDFLIRTPYSSFWAI